MSRWDDLWKPPEPEPRVNGAPIQINGNGTTYAQAALRKEAEVVAAAGNGTRNETLNKAAFRMGRHVGAGNIDAGTVRTVLAEASRSTGLPEDEIQTVLRDNENSGINQGATVPRHPAVRPDVPGVTVLPDGTEVPPGPPLNPIIDWHELFGTEDEGEEWIIEPLLPARRMVALYSAPKAGKSLLMLELAAAMARGTDVLGTTLDRPRRVLYVDFENDPRGDIRTRLEAMELGPEQLGNLCYLTYPSMAKMDTAQGALDLMRHVEHYDCEVVVIDTVSRAVAGEENENDTWLAFYRHTGLALKRAQVACIRLDHSGKDHTKGMRGGSAKSGDVDAVWRLTAIGENTIVLECTDNRMPVPVKSITLTRQDYPLAHVPAGVSWQAVADAKTQVVDDLLEQLGVPCSASFRAAGKALREAGHGADNGPLAKAVKSRKMRLDLPAPSVPQNTPEQPRTAGEVFRRTPPPLGGVRNTPDGTAEQQRNDPDELVSCKGCFKPTTNGVASRNDGRCATCARDAGQTTQETP